MIKVEDDSVVNFAAAAAVYRSAMRAAAASSRPTVSRACCSLHDAVSASNDFKRAALTAVSALTD